MELQSYIICATPRSGSTLLCDLLTGSRVAGRPASFYRRESIDNWAQRLGVPLTERTDNEVFERPYLEAIRREGEPPAQACSACASCGRALRS